MPDTTLPKSSFLIKFIECFLVAFAIINSYNLLILFPASSNFQEYKQTLDYMRVFNFFLVIACIIFAVAYPIIWHLKERKEKISLTSRHTFFRAVIRFWLSIMICTYGFAKILGTQFAKDVVRNDSLAKDLSGFDLTWFYFSYSYPFSVTIAFLQLMGAILLLFRKAVLPGAAILLPVMLNIALLNFFYKIQDAAQMNAVFFTIALLYLLSLFWGEIKNIVLSTSAKLPAVKVKNIIKYSIRFIAVGLSFAIVYYLSVSQSRDFLIGKWSIEAFVKDGNTVKADEWLTDSRAWRNVYFDEAGGFILNPNPYVIEIKRAQKGKFHYDSNSHTLYFLTGTTKNVNDHFEFKVIETNNKHMVWTGQYREKLLQLNLFKND